MTADGGTTRGVGRQRVAAVLVRMYPRLWRDRYGEEIIDLLVAAPLTGFTVLDVVRGALDARLHWSDPVGDSSAPLARMRSAAATTFGAWVMFCFAAAVVGPTTNDPRFAAAASAHPVIGVLRWVAIAGLTASVLVVGCAALPLAVAAAWQAWRRQDRVALALFAAPPAGVAVFAGYTALLINLPDQPVRSIGNVVMTVSWFLLGVTVVGVAGVGASTALMRRTQFAPALLRLAGWAAAATAAAMAIALLAGAAYGLQIWIETPALFVSSNGVLATSLRLTWVALLLVAAVATVTAIFAALGGIRTLLTAVSVSGP